MPDVCSAGVDRKCVGVGMCTPVCVHANVFRVASTHPYGRICPFPYHLFLSSPNLALLLSSSPAHRSVHPSVSHPFIPPSSQFSSGFCRCLHNTGVQTFCLTLLQVRFWTTTPPFLQFSRDLCWYKASWTEVFANLCSDCYIIVCFAGLQLAVLSKYCSVLKNLVFWALSLFFWGRWIQFKLRKKTSI